MKIQAKIILDSVTDSEVRLTTFEVVFPRFILPELNTHRALSKNSASSRAIPVKTLLEKAVTSPAYPVFWGKNQSGMQANESVTFEQEEEAISIWDRARASAIKYAKELLDIPIHKQITNRLLEPFLPHTVIITATDLANFFSLRCHPDAQPEIRRLAFCMLKSYYDSTPKLLRENEWHMPYLTEEDQYLDLEIKKKISVARSARVSYLTHDGKRDYTKDLELYDRLLSSGHMSPFEHVATPMDIADRYSGNFRGWIQYRKTIVGENRTEMPSLEEMNNYFENIQDWDPDK